MNLTDKNTILLELQYLPPIQYFSKLVHYPTIYIEKQENYTKGTYRNRAHLASANGVINLSIPLHKGKHQKKPITEVTISYAQPWFAEHWHAIRSCYGNAPYFEYYATEIEGIYRQKMEGLFELNKTFLNFFIETLGLDVSLNFTSNYQKEVPENWLDFRNAIHPKPHRQKEDLIFNAQPYPQIFEERHGFLPNLSILDLLFCAGPEAILILESCSN